MLKGPAALMLLLVAFAGCADQGKPSTGATTSNSETSTSPVPTSSTRPNTTSIESPAPSLEASTPEWLDCTHHVTSAYFNDGGLSDALPPGMTPLEILPGHWSGGSEVFACGSFVVDNETVVQSGMIAFQTVVVTPDATLSRSDATHEFILNAWSDSPTLVEAYARQGFPMRGVARIDFEQTATETRLAVQPGGMDVWAFVAPGGSAGHADSFDAVARWYYAVDEGVRWMDLDLNGQLDYQVPNPGTFSYAGPPWQEYTGRSAETLPSIYDGDTLERIETSFGP